MSDKLFGSNFEDEIYRSMESALIKNQADDTYGSSKLTKAANLLSVAAEIFDNAGMSEESQEIADIIKSLSEEIK